MALEFTGPLALALFSSRRLLDFVWVILAIIGLWMLLPTGATQSAIDPLGAALALGAGVCWSLYIIFGQKAGAQHGRHTVALGTWVAALLVLPIGIWHAGTDLLSVDLLPIAFSVLMSLEPAVAAMCGLAFLGEKLLWGQWLAVGAIIIASAGAAATIKPKS